MEKIMAIIGPITSMCQSEYEMRGLQRIILFYIVFQRKGADCSSSVQKLFPLLPTL